jgi:hypothetical protein
MVVNGTAKLHDDRDRRRRRVAQADEKQGKLDRAHGQRRADHRAHLLGDRPKEGRQQRVEQHEAQKGEEERRRAFKPFDNHRRARQRPFRDDEVQPQIRQMTQSRRKWRAFMARAYAQASTARKR